MVVYFLSRNGLRLGGIALNSSPNIPLPQSLNPALNPQGNAIAGYYHSEAAPLTIKHPNRVKDVFI